MKDRWDLANNDGWCDQREDWQGACVVNYPRNPWYVAPSRGAPHAPAMFNFVATAKASAAPIKD